MNAERTERGHRRSRTLMWPGVVLAAPALGGLGWLDNSTVDSFTGAGIGLLLMLAYLAGLVWSLCLGLPAAYWSWQLERNAFQPLPTYSLSRWCVAITLGSGVILWKGVWEFVAMIFGFGQP